MMHTLPNEMNLRLRHSYSLFAEPFPSKILLALIVFYAVYSTVLQHKYMSVSVSMIQYMYDFLEAVIMRQTAQEEAYRKLDEMAAKLTETLRKSAKMVCNAT